MPSVRTHVPRNRRTAACGLLVISVALALAACGDAAPSPSDAEPSPTTSDLSAIACATDDPFDVGELTGAWQGNDDGVYYIRQVGDCVWWFGTELKDIEPGVTRQPGFANVASGRVEGTQVVLEWADVPMGNLLNGGGLTYVYDDENGTLTLTEQRGGGIPFGGSVLTRIEPNASPDATPSAASSP